VAVADVVFTPVNPIGAGKEIKPSTGTCTGKVLSIVIVSAAFAPLYIACIKLAPVIGTVVADVKLYNLPIL
jgi:hypothetical protein